MICIVKSGTTYDSLKSAYKFSNLSFTKLRSVYKNRTGKTFEDSDYESFGLIDENGNLTNAGVLLADESPVRHSRLFCTRWNGLDKAGGLVDAIDDREYSGSIITLLQSGIEFVTSHSMKAFKKLADRRVEYPEYPDRAVMEGLVNALIHRNYMEVGSEVHIDMYDDRLEIYSPGGMFSGKTLKEQGILSVPSKRRNPILADIFGRLNYMERRGSGFKKIISDYQFQENYTEKLAPVFDDSNGDFVLTLYNLNYNVIQTDPQGDPQTDPQGDPQDDSANSIIKLMRNNPKITREEIAKLLGVSPSTIKRRIGRMTNVHYVGSGYSGHWEIDE